MWTHTLVVFAGMVFGQIVGLIGLAGFVIDHVDAFPDVIANAKEFHIHEFGSFLLDTIVDDSVGSCIVGDDGCCFLQVAKFS